MSAARQRLIVLMYHRVLPERDPLIPNEMWVEAFESHVRALTRFFRVLPLVEAVARLSAGTLPSRSVSITFDDGYRDNHALALPILEKYGATATFFVATGFLDGGRMWNDTIIEAVRSTPHADVDLSGLGLGRWSLRSDDDRRRAVEGLLGQLKYLPPDERLTTVEAVAGRLDATLPDDLMMDADQVRDLYRRGMQIGGHTVSHPILARVDDEVARHEIAAGRDALREMTGAPVDVFAYPNGKPGTDYRRRHVAMVRDAGFDAAVSTGFGCSGPDTDPLQVGRIGPWDRSGMKLALRLLRSYFGAEAEAA